MNQATELLSRPSIHPADQMAVSMARLLRDGESVFHGVASPLPMVAIHLARRTHAPHLIYLNIPGGVDGGAALLPSGSSASGTLCEGAASFFPLTEIFDLSARGGLDTAFLGGAQIDQFGHINLSVIGPFERPKVRLPGGAGSAVILPTVKRAILWRARHDPKSFPAKVDFVTATGNVAYVVTPLGIFRREAASDGEVASDGYRLRWWRLFPGCSLDEVRAQTGFPIELSAEYAVESEPTETELAVLNSVDPHGVRREEF